MTDEPNTTVIAVGVRGNPSVPIDVRKAMRLVLEAARVDVDGKTVSLPFESFETLCAALHVELELQSDGNGAMHVIPLPLYVGDDGKELDDEDVAVQMLQSGDLSPAALRLLSRLSPTMLPIGVDVRVPRADKRLAEVLAEAGLLRWQGRDSISGDEYYTRTDAGTVALRFKGQLPDVGVLARDVYHRLLRSSRVIDRDTLVYLSGGDKALEQSFAQRRLDKRSISRARGRVVQRLVELGMGLSSSDNPHQVGLRQAVIKLAQGDGST